MLFQFLALVCIFIVGLELALALFLFLRSKFDVKQKPKLLKPNYQKDVVYLAQFPCVPYIRSISPFCLKLETWLRMHKIRYESVYTLKFGPKGQIPYVEFNGEQIPDSAIIIDKLSKHFNVNDNDGIDKEQLAFAHSMSVMVENRTAIAGFFWRYGRNMKLFVNALCLNTYPAKSLKFWTFFQPMGTRFKTVCHGLGKHEDQEIAEFSFQDLKAISDALGDKLFFLGATPKQVDCVLFGNLVQFIYNPLPFPQKEFISRECKNLGPYVDRLRDHFFPDWNALCSAESMDGFKEKSYAEAIAASK